MGSHWGGRAPLGLVLALAPEYTGVTMPHDENCPYDDCRKMVRDWYIEWYPKSIQAEIGRHKRAMDCPWCRHAVVPMGLRVVQPNTPLRPEVRDYQSATAYARTQTPVNSTTNYASLEEFLADPDNSAKAVPYKHCYWPNVSIP